MKGFSLRLPSRDISSFASLFFSFFASALLVVSIFSIHRSTGHAQLDSVSRSGLIFGMGTGRCGTVTLSKLLASQPGCNATSFLHETRPILPWESAHTSDVASTRLSAIRQRLRCTGGKAGDVALFYLAYARDMLEIDPHIRFIVLQRARDEVVRSYVQKQLRCNLWSACPNKTCRPGDIKWLPAFPKYPCLTNSTIADGVRQYYDDYESKVAGLTRDFPLNVRVYESPAIFSDESRQYEMLRWAGFPHPTVTQW